ncbi:uncharacterized protein LOC144039680 isoform X2 [Vanacampus margaritifer]
MNSILQLPLMMPANESVICFLTFDWLAGAQRCKFEAWLNICGKLKTQQRHQNLEKGLWNSPFQDDPAATDAEWATAALSFIPNQLQSAKGQKHGRACLRPNLGEFPSARMLTFHLPRPPLPTFSVRACVHACVIYRPGSIGKKCIPETQAQLPSPPMSSQTSGGEAGPPRRVKQKTILEEVTVTFSSPAAWLLVAALVLTWTAVAVVVLDLLDYQTLAGVPPPPAIARRGLKANRGGVRSMGSSCVGGAAPPPSPQASADWLEMMWTFAASLVAPDEEEEEVEDLHWEEL